MKVINKKPVPKIDSNSIISHAVIILIPSETIVKSMMKSAKSIISTDSEIYLYTIATHSFGVGCPFYTQAQMVFLSAISYLELLLSHQIS